MQIFGLNLEPMLQGRKQQHHSGGFGSFLSGLWNDAQDYVLKPVVRGVSLAADTGIQLAAGTVRQEYRDWTHGGPIGDLLKGDVVVGAGENAVAQANPFVIARNPTTFKQTTLGQAVTGGKDIGTGYLPGGAAAQAAAGAQRSVASIAGHALTPGRRAASVVTEPGTRPYNLLSG